MFDMMNSSLKLLIHGTRAMVNQNGVGAPPSLVDNDDDDDDDGNGNDASLDPVERLKQLNEMLMFLKRVSESSENHEPSSSSHHGNHETIPFPSAASGTITSKATNRSASPPPPPAHAPGSTMAVTSAAAAAAVSSQNKPAGRGGGGAGGAGQRGKPGQFVLSSYQKQFDSIKSVLASLVSILDWNAEVRLMRLIR
jgi:hypothetical protein